LLKVKQAVDCSLLASHLYGLGSSQSWLIDRKSLMLPHSSARTNVEQIIG